MAKIHAPNTAYNGISATVEFTNGIGETNDKHLIGWFKEKGYTVTETQKEALQETLLGDEVINTPKEEKPTITPKPRPQTQVKKPTTTNKK